MSAPAAIRATFAQYAMVKTRGVLVLHMEVPLEAQAEVFAALGYPLPGNEVWVGIARLVVAPDAGVWTAEELAESNAKAEKLSAYFNSPSANAQRAKAAYALASPGEQAVTRAALLAKDARFQEWVSLWRDEGTVGDEIEAVQFIRDRCFYGASRTLIADDPDCLAKFLALEVDYKIHIGALPEPR
jgi:hypothetical protein